MSRDVPFDLSGVLLRPHRGASCGDLGALECAVQRFPSAAGQLLELALLATGIAVVASAFGVAALAFGLRGWRRAIRQAAPAAPRSSGVATSDDPRRANLVLVAVGAWLVVPGIWLLGSLSLAVLH